ncbi:MAG: TRAP transporter small permease [Oscillospiraceae bacterium]|nr:TRAP transporter small permease [Oscillospiraceae bacterium]
MKKTLDLLGKIGKWLIAAALAAMVFMTFVNAALRYTFHTNIPVFEELARFLFVWSAFLGAIIAYVQGKHVGVDLVTSKLSGLPKLIVNLIAEALIMVAIACMFKGAVQYYLVTYINPAPCSNLPYGVLTSSGVVLSFALGVITIRDIIILIKNYVKSKKQEVEA